MRTGISVVINTLNEERNLPNALASVVTWADDIVVVDMHSEDRTCEIACDFGARVFMHERIRDFDRARQFAIDQAASEWVLILDADEMVVPVLSKVLCRIAAGSEADVVVIPRLNYDLGLPMMYSGSGPDQDRQMRFFKKGHLVVSGEIHNFLSPVQDARILTLNFKSGAYLAHFGILDLTKYLEKMVRYTGIEAAQKYEAGQRSSGCKMLWSALKVFLSRYVVYGGFRDGWRGLYRSLYLVVYRMATHAKLMQLQSIGDENVVRTNCNDRARQILEEYQANRQPTDIMT